MSKTNENTQLQSPVSYLLFHYVHKDSRLHLKETKQLDLLIPAVWNVWNSLQSEMRKTLNEEI